MNPLAPGLPDPSDLPVWVGTRDELLAAVFGFPLSDVADALQATGSAEPVVLMGALTEVV
jgi:hypothetical protein